MFSSVLRIVLYGYGRMTTVLGSKQIEFNGLVGYGPIEPAQEVTPTPRTEADQTRPRRNAIARKMIVYKPNEEPNRASVGMTGFSGSVVVSVSPGAARSSSSVIPPVATF